MLPILNTFRNIIRHWCAWHFIMLTVKSFLVLPHISMTGITGTKPLLLHLDMWQLQISRHSTEEILRCGACNLCFISKTDTHTHTLCWFFMTIYNLSLKGKTLYYCTLRTEYQSITYTCANTINLIHCWAFLLSLCWLIKQQASLFASEY